MQTKEIWKNIPNYDGYYQVSNLGRIRSVDRYVFMKRNNCYKLLKGNIVSIFLDKYGYLNRQLSKKGLNKTYRVHKLVAMAFLNHIPNGYNGLVVNHINFDKTDNRLSNLELITQRENANQKHIKSTSKYVGVYWNKQKYKWVSKIYYKSKHKFLGYFTDEYQAHLAYQKELKIIQDAAH